ncbi:LysR family transcriptional regulator [Sutterella sp.]|uniref:LysR family transcriptional regulator n=1 Tax=Sutterella sp. TaxID=1981025 RepID=UPI0026E04F23|nr:LysR family transcriptional regulator [Sutterella sp.]MDO5531941.1 LysR family transcriptional regulator [Sutterella sp.]
MRDNLSLSDLQFFLTLCRTGSLTETAHQHSMTKGAASKTLSRLRFSFGETLFMRRGRGMTPTTRALEIEEQLRGPLQRIQSLTSPSVFAPELRHRIFRIATYDANVKPMLHPAVKKMLSIAKGHAGLDMRTFDENFWNDLAGGMLDFALLPVTGMPEGFCGQYFCTDAYVYVVDSHHPLLERQRRRQLTIEDVLEYRQIKMQVNTHSSSHDRNVILDTDDTPSYASFRSSFFVSSLLLVEDTDLITMVPCQLAAAMSRRLPVEILGRPEKGVIHTVHLLWHRSRDRDPEYQWARSVILSSRQHLIDPAEVPVIQGV